MEVTQARGGQISCNQASLATKGAQRYYWFHAQGSMATITGNTATQGPETPSLQKLHVHPTEASENN